MADTFQLDTSGAVEWPDGEVVRWDRLSPFAQGYVEALFGELNAGFFPVDGGYGVNAFSDLHHEALALILRDCEARVRHCPSEGDEPRSIVSTFEKGKRFWRWRQEGQTKNFPPLTPFLSDDGKVCLKEAEQ